MGSPVNSVEACGPSGSQGLHLAGLPLLGVEGIAVQGVDQQVVVVVVVVADAGHQGNLAGPGAQVHHAPPGPIADDPEGAAERLAVLAAVTAGGSEIVIGSPA